MSTDWKQLQEVLLKLKKAVDEDPESEYSDLSEVGADDIFGDMEDDPAAAFLAQHGDKKKDAEAPSEKKPVQYRKDWKAPEVKDEKQKAAIKKLMDEGYSEREAHRTVGSHKEAKDWTNPAAQPHNPSKISSKMWNVIKQYATRHSEEQAAMEGLISQPEKSPMKYSTGQLSRAHEQHVGDYQKAYNDFLQSGKIKTASGDEVPVSKLSGRDRHKAITDWKTQWKTANPQHEENYSNVSEKQSIYSQSKAEAEAARENMKHTILTGGASGEETYTPEEAMQHLGVKTQDMEGGGHSEIRKDPVATFGESSPKYMAALADEMARKNKIKQKLNPEQQERMHRVDSAAKTQGVVRRRPGGDK